MLLKHILYNTQQTTLEVFAFFTSHLLNDKLKHQRKTNFIKTF